MGRPTGGLTGWHLSTSLRWAILTAAEVASLGTPNARYGSGGNGEAMMWYDAGQW